MSRLNRFPRGYNITVVDKQDILQAIDDNIVDKEVLKEIIDNLEKDAEEFLRQDRWTGIPFLGNIRKPKDVQYYNQEQTKALVKEAKENLDAEKYLAFRTNLGAFIQNHVRDSRYYNYTTSVNINRYKMYYRHIRQICGSNVARFITFTISQLDYRNVINNCYAV